MSLASLQPASPESLKSKSLELFDPLLAAEINQEIDAQTPPLPRLGTPAPFSVATFGLADILYAKLGTGRFSNLPTICWNGMDGFVYLPGKEQPFSYTTSAGQILQPGLMDTDGGSIPRILQSLSKFSSWGYAPGYMIHDWIFTARKCGFPPDNNFTFEDSATILAECLKTLMEIGFTDYDGKLVKLPKAEDTLYLIYLAVRSPIAKRLWDNPDTVNCRIQS